MAYATPRVAKQHVNNFEEKDGKQSSQRNMDAWKCEIDDKIWQMNMDIHEFLHYFVPSDKALPPLKARDPFDVPVGGKEVDMYKPLCDGLKQLVRNFGPAKHLDFHNNAHQEIRFPFQLGEQAHHATKPDVVASLPGVTFDPTVSGRWRHISLVFEAKATESGDPMVFRSEEHNDTLVQLSKSARNILVAQSRLFAFSVGIYGSVARIFRFDHAGAVCTEPFKYAADNGAILQEFLWRLVNPIPSGCDIVGGDPTIGLVTTSDARHVARSQLQAAGLDLNNERMKACRWITIPGTTIQQPATKYLAYELLFINPRLFSRATTIWEALELDADNKPTGKHVIIKDAWRQHARASEAQNYERIYTHLAQEIVRVRCAGAAEAKEVEDAPLSEGGAQGAMAGRRDAAAEAHGETEEPELSRTHAFKEAWGATWSGLALCVLSHELGEDEGLDGCGPGHQTCTGFFHAHHHHRWFERDHVRLVSHTVGTPISQFQSTREMVQALRDGIYGHMLAYRAGIMHRDVSEGNIMIANGRGFLHDFDYGFNWKLFLQFLDFEDTEESWEEFVKTERGIPRTSPSEPVAWPRAQMPPGLTNGWADNGSSPPPRAVYVNGREEFRLGAILAERKVGRKMEYLVRWEGYRDDENTWEPRKHLEKTEALENWEKLTLERREELSLRYLNTAAQPEERVNEPDVVVDEGLQGAKPSAKDIARRMMECKLRTGTFYFMSVEVLQQKMVIHEARHDLESFYWLLLWLVLRHTNHSEYDCHGRLKKLFDQITEEECADKKKLWLMRDVKRFKIYDNAPLNDLLKEFSVLCNANSELEPPLQAPSPVTHANVLQLFDRVLERPDWPQNDKARLFIPKQDPELVHKARPLTAWGSTNQSTLARLNQSGASAAPRTSHSLIQDDHPVATVAEAIIARGSLAANAGPHTPRTVFSASEVPAIERQQSRRYMSDPNSPSPSARGKMPPPPLPLRIQLPFPSVGGVRAASERPGRLGSHSAGKAAGMPPPTHVRSRSSDAIQPPKSSEGDGQPRTERRKRSHEEYAVDAGEVREQSSSKRTRTQSGPQVPLPSTHGMELRKRTKS